MTSDLAVLTYVVLAGFFVSTLLGRVLAAESGGMAESELLAGAEARIEKYRKADAAISVMDAAGKPVAGVKVAVEQTRHAFLFGCNIFCLNPAENTPAQKAYQDRYAALLNYATLPFYWGGFEHEQGRTGTDRILAMAEWCRDHVIVAKGHPLCWHEVPPRWLAGKPLHEVQALQLGRITRDVTAFRGLVHRWDVVNEAVIMPDFGRGENPIAQWCRDVGRVELIKQTFAAALEADPEATLLLNDFDTSPKYEALIRGCLDAGVPIGVIGIQSHMHGGYRGAAWAWEVCERFAKFGKPLHFTEVTIQSGEMKRNINWGGRYDDWPSTPEGEARQAREVVEFYRILFSHPAVEAITWWDFSDDRAWMGAPSGLVRKDMSPKPAYDELMKRIKGEWWTQTALEAGADGGADFRGFLGDYRVTVTADGKAPVVRTFTLRKDAPNLWKVTLE
ncbi:MAG: endo-1,4-beta-xylanase [Phycisphaerae bacterium]